MDSQDFKLSINTSRVSELLDYMSTGELLTLVDEASDSIMNKILETVDQLRVGNKEAALKAIHTAKGEAGTLGADILQKIICEDEAFLRSSSYLVQINTIRYKSCIDEFRQAIITFTKDE